MQVVVTNAVPEFTPVNISIRLDTAEELHSFTEMAGWGGKVVSVVAGAQNNHPVKNPLFSPHTLFCVLTDLYRKLQPLQE